MRSSFPPRPSPTSRPPSFRPPPREEPRSATGAAVHFRPARLDAAELPVKLACRFRFESAPVGPLAVLDLSATGFAATNPSGLALEPGSALESFELILGERVIWSGEAVVVHGSPHRMGGRFTSTLLDLDHLRLGATLESRLGILREQRELLPPEWRAAVSDLRQLIEDARLEVDEFERVASHDPLRRAEDETVLFAALRGTWGAVYFEAIAALHEQSKSLDERMVPIARAYASSALMPLLMACPMHRRAYEKPLGYAGDYRMMELYFTRDLTGDGLFGRFLHSIAQTYTLGRAVIARQTVMREAVETVIHTKDDAPARVLSLAAGPALELRRLIEDISALPRGLELILLDQDEAAHETAHGRLMRLLVERHKNGLPIQVQCLHFSVRQLLKPQTPDEIRVRDIVLANLDLVYSAGLYDYLPEPVAVRLTELVYGRLRPGGRLLLGNLVETPDTTWLMEYVLGWYLQYRTDASMRTLAQSLTPAPARVDITRDRTGRCLFLDVAKPR